MSDKHFYDFGTAWQCLAAGDLAAADRYFLRAFHTTLTSDAE